MPRGWHLQHVNLSCLLCSTLQSIYRRVCRKAMLTWQYLLPFWPPAIDVYQHQQQSAIYKCFNRFKSVRPRRQSYSCVSIYVSHAFLTLLYTFMRFCRLSCVFVIFRNALCGQLMRFWKQPFYLPLKWPKNEKNSISDDNDVNDNADTEESYPVLTSRCASTRCSSSSSRFLRFVQKHETAHTNMHASIATLYPVYTTSWL